MIREPRPMPKPETPVIDAHNRMTRDWYDWLREMDRVTRDLIRSNADHETRIADLETP